MAKLLKVPYISVINKNSTAEIASSVLNTLDRNHINVVPWKNFPYQPKASFTIAYGDNCIFLKYYVTEETILATYCKPNDPVHKDSCVELFIAFNAENNYYNLEFNCIGTCYAAYGKDKANRELLNVSLINLIRSQSVIKKEGTAGPAFNWELSLVIPFEVFGFHHITSLTDKVCKVNFCKCGDDLPTSHYLCWNDIQSPLPDFHLLEFFGDAQFLSLV